MTKLPNMTREELVRIKNTAASGGHVKVWSRQLDELCEFAIAEYDRRQDVDAAAPAFARPLE